MSVEEVQAQERKKAARSASSTDFLSHRYQQPSFTQEQFDGPHKPAEVVYRHFSGTILPGSSFKSTVSSSVDGGWDEHGPQSYGYKPIRRE